MTGDTPDRPPPRRRTPNEQADEMQRWEERCRLIDEVRLYLDENLSDTSQYTRDIAQFKYVIGDHLGASWVAANAEFHAPEKPGKGAKYLRRDSDPEIATLAQHYLRLGELARRLFEFAAEDFYELLCANLSRRDLEGAAFEADVVRTLLGLPMLIDLREERNVIGDDYDIDVWLRLPNTKWSIEVKTKHDAGPYTRTGLLNTIRGARKQLPAGGLGTIFLKLPQAWATDPDYQGEVVKVFDSFFRNTSRVHAVVTVWDIITHDAANEKSWSWKPGRAVYRSPTIDRLLDELLGHYELLWGQPFDLAGPNAPF